MKESSGMMIVDIRRPSQCDRAPDSWQLTGPRRQHAGCQHNTNQHPAAGTAPEHCPCGHCLRLRHVWRGRLLVTAADEVLILTVIHPIVSSAAAPPIVFSNFYIVIISHNIPRRCPEVGIGKDILVCESSNMSFQLWTLCNVHRCHNRRTLTATLTNYQRYTL